jgi:uncharacterized protein
MNRVLELFPREHQVGVFRGFSEGGLEFHADLVLPYRSEFQNIPMHGQFVAVQLETPNEAVLGRITSLSSEGRLTGPAGEQFNIRALKEDRPVPEQLREDYLKYRVDVRVLGVVRVDGKAVTFVPSHRRLPHVGSPVGFLPDEILRHLAGHYGDGAKIGVYALGEFVYGDDDDDIRVEPWMQVKQPVVNVKFPMRQLVARRSFIFARAGFGKSNLNKLLFSRLYAERPTVEKRSGRHVRVGTIIFDPDGEYFWPDDKGRPALCDVPELRDEVVVFTSRRAPSQFYQSFVAGGIKLDVRRVHPNDVISIAVPIERHDQQNVRKLRGMNPPDWASLVDLVHTHGNGADLERIRELLRLQPDQQAEALAARANMTAIVRMLHDPASQLMDVLLHALSEGKLCVVDLSQMRGGPSLVLSGLILRRIFDNNQEEFTKADPNTIPTIAVIEEAQSVLNDRSSAAAPYIEWVKEGRKYDLGAVMVTQQPGSIPGEILSQGDNWFLFHLLSASDLQSVKRANAHFSDDLLSALLNEPIPGQGVFWSSVGNSQYPIPMRVVSFESLYERADPTYSRPGEDIYATRLRRMFSAGVGDDDATIDEDASPGQDVLRHHERNAIEALSTNDEVRRLLVAGGIRWRRLVEILRDALPSTMRDREKIAYNLVPNALNEMCGLQGEAWVTERRGGKQTLFVIGHTLRK